MGWSVRLGRIAGIDVYVHATFALLLLWVGFVSYQPHHNINEVWEGLAFILCLFGIVVLHELGHALTARRYGIKTRDITLLPIGGLARLERMPTDPKQELLVALAGPAVNVVLAGLLFGILTTIGWAAGSVEELSAQLSTFSGNLLVQLFAANLFLAVFNLIPAFPLDGGRVFRAILAMKLDYVRATQVAASLGQSIAILFGLLGMMSGNVLLMVIALFVWIGAAAEAGAVQFKAGLAGMPVERAMIREYATLTPDDTLGAAVGTTLAGFQEDFPVLSGETVVGILPRTALLTGLVAAGPEGRVGDFMQREFETAEPEEMLEVVFERLNGTTPVVPVIRGGRLRGLLTLTNIAELVTFREAYRERKLQPRVPANPDSPSATRPVGAPTG
jgi:Zn-dependent protease/CBS domain-containing protein